MAIIAIWSPIIIIFIVMVYALLSLPKRVNNTPIKYDKGDHNIDDWDDD